MKKKAAKRVVKKERRPMSKKTEQTEKPAPEPEPTPEPPPEPDAPTQPIFAPADAPAEVPEAEALVQKRFELKKIHPHLPDDEIDRMARES